MAVLIEKTCIGCGVCLQACPYDALEIGNEGIAVVDPAKCNECGKCLAVCPVEALILPEKGKTLQTALKKELEKADKNIVSDNLKNVKNAAIPALGVRPELADYNDGVWVFAEHLEGKLANVTLELLGTARILANKLETQVSAVLIGDKVESIIPVLFENGADKVYFIADEVFHFYRTEAYMEGFCYLIKKYKPEILLMGATTTGRDLAGAVATSIRTGLTADCTGLDIDMDKRILLASRPAFGGNIMATIVCENHRPQMATVRPRVMKMPVPEPCRAGTVIKEKIDINGEDLQTKVLEIVKEQLENIKLDDAQIIVSGGRGIQDQKGFQALNELANVLGGVVSGSRGAVEKGLIDTKRQVGQTGHTVAPRLYFAVGISGAIQHIVGMQGSETIIAINTDPNCKMMNMATYSIVGDAIEVVTKLTKEFKKEMGTVSDNGTVQLCPVVKGDEQVG